MKTLKRIYSLLQADERKKVVKIAITVFFQAILDFIGLAALLPILYYLLEEGQRNKVAFIFCLIAIAIILLKSLLSTIFIRYQNNCLLSFFKRLSFSLFSSYYNRGLIFIREQGSNKLQHQINAMCYAFSHSLLAPICRMAGDLLLIILVTTALLIWNGTIVLILFASFIPFMCFYFLAVRKKVREYGKDDMNSKREQAKIVSDTFRGYVELEVNGAFPALQNSFLEGMEKISQNRKKLDMLLRLPLVLSELSVVCGLAILLIFGEGDIKMLISVFAVASFRLLPALRSILGGWTQVQNSIYCLDVIEEGLNEPITKETTEESEITFNKEIGINGIHYSYPNGELILENLNCNILKGEYVGICGTSGVGKSTLLNLVIGLLKPGAGSVSVDGVEINDKTRNSWMKMIGYVPQDVFIFNSSLAQNIALGCKNIDYTLIDNILEKVSLCQWVKTLPDGSDTILSEAGAKLSGGQKQRIGIARALYKKASVLLLDESTSALDNNTEREINNTLLQLKESEHKLTIISIAHRESSLSYCDRIITIE